MDPVKAKEDGGGSGSVQSLSPFPVVHCPWNPEFTTRRDLDYSTENEIHIEVRAALGAEVKNVVRAFMLGPDESDVCLPQADKVEAFCFGASLESLERRDVSEPPVA